ncbi:VCBS repeat-containing protein (plasmid) [Hymenobacter sp. BRD67]|nr:VCBS repeat-containing protein [Hymenobacter sp. BRD67]
MALGDLDGDGDLDLVAGASSTVAVLFNDGTGTFTGMQTVAVGAYLQWRWPT